MGWVPRPLALINPRVFVGGWLRRGVVRVPSGRYGVVWQRVVELAEARGSPVGVEDVCASAVSLTGGG